MNVMRFTVVDANGSVSFVFHGEALPALLASCAHDPRDIASLLAGAEPYYPRLSEHVLNSLAVFDEHNAPGNPSVIHQAFDFLQPHELPAFRVIDERTREESLRPVKAGAIVLNLLDRRIVQIQNTFHKIQRAGRWRVYQDSKPTERTFVYRIPRTWSLVP
ncbi:MAG TPA: hypothetical protein VNL92_04520 [Dehalococcoidia bacterium]|nr:hypothetical protein [Dehalococcoidia bacterium]